MKKSAKSKMGAAKNMLAKALAARAVMGAGAPPAAPPMGAAPMGMKKGGSFRTVANGIAQRGKTKGKMVKMAGGK
jgi:hypothetical protein